MRNHPYLSYKSDNVLNPPTPRNFNSPHASSSSRPSLEDALSTFIQGQRVISGGRSVAREDETGTNPNPIPMAWEWNHGGLLYRHRVWAQPINLRMLKNYGPSGKSGPISTQGSIANRGPYQFGDQYQARAHTER
ncbi:hypothetical protein CFP56_003433 [Quercus suber]|uniref:Uncharacterized protein n=1 Tax=Quercus suber TaxID=58331 RepID=A0AAW0LD09_QUESU